MEIKWHDQTCFSIKGKTAHVVVNPHKGIKAKLKGNLVLAADENNYEPEKVEGLKPMPDEKPVPPRVLNWPGEYEALGVGVMAIPHNEGIIFKFEIDDVRFCHLDHLEDTLTSELTEKIGDVDVLLLPVSKEGLSGKKAHSVVEEIEPRAVIPMIGPFDDFLKEVGQQNVETMGSFKLTTRGSLSDDKTDYVVLEKV